MYLSRIMLDTTSKKTMLALNNPNKFHGALDDTEDGERSRKLWRVDYFHGNPCLLILSQNALELSSVAEQFGFDSTYETKDYSPLIEKVSEGSIWHFRLTANPTVKKFDEKKKKSVICAHITTEYQMQWLREKAENNGFEVDETNSLVTQSKWIDFVKNSNSEHVRLLSVTYEGILKVTDKEKFISALLNGIGREKAYGMGLLTIVR